MVARRATFSATDGLHYRLQAACALMGVTSNTLRTYADTAGVPIKRASEITPGAPAVRVFTLDALFQLAQWRRAQGYLKAPTPGAGPVKIAVEVIKGGTGKTTTAVETSINLQLMGLRVLLIDLDTQANATQLMGYEPDLTIEEAADFDVTEEAIIVNTLASVMTPFLDRARGGHARHAEGQIIKMPFGSNGPHLLPADTFLSDIEQTLAGAKVSRELSLRKLLAAGCQGAIPGFDLSGYDVIMFDCPPNVSHVSTIALAAADIVIAPIRLDAFSMKGLTKLMRELEGLREAFRVQPELIILPTHYAPQLSRVYRMQTRLGQYRDMMAPGVISASEEFPKSLDAYLPLTVQRPTCASVKEYKDFAEFLHGRILATATELARATT